MPPGATREPESVPVPCTGLNSHKNDPSGLRVSFSHPQVSENRLTMYTGVLVKDLKPIPPVETWKAVMPLGSESATQRSSLVTGQERS